jgi:DivIVA domain-containing protein
MTTTTEPAGWTGGRRLTPADVREARFGRSSVFHPGYDDTEVDHFLERVGEELAKLHAEKAQLREQVHALQARLDDEPRPEAPSMQAVGLLAAAQQTADQYVAEAEAFSRVMTTEAREHYEKQVSEAREKVGALIQAAHDAAARIAGGGASGDPGSGDVRTAELQEQVRYLQAFGQACRTQLRAYLEALLADVEHEWGAAHPEGLPAPSPSRAEPLRSGRPPVSAGASGVSGPVPAEADAASGPAASGPAEPRTVEAAAVLLSGESLRPDEGARRP